MAFSILRASSLRGSPLPDPDRLTIIWTTRPGHPQATEGARIVEYFAWRDRNRTFDAVGTMLDWSSTVESERNGEPAERLSGARFNASAFRARNVQAEPGRFLSSRGGHRWFRRWLLFELTPFGLTTFLVTPVLFALIAVIASYVPARRATRLEPQAVLRSE